MNSFLSLIKRIKRSIKNGSFLHKIKNRYILATRSFYIKKKIDPNKIAFMPYQGRYECNPKWICEELIKRNKKFNLVWIAKEKGFNEKEQFPKELKIVKFPSKECYEEISSAKIVVMNAMELNYLKYKKKKDQFYIQTWHGSMGFKILFSDNNSAWRVKAHKLGDITDYIVSNSKFEEKVYRECYWQKPELLKYGHPRNDILMNEKDIKKYSNLIRKKYDIDKKTKIALYAPTYKDDFKLESYDLDFDRIKKALEEKYKCPFVIFTRVHFKLYNNVNFSKVTKGTINVSAYPDMQELLCAVDVGITDYSSWMCDFVLTRRPGFIYAGDIGDYEKGRGFYYPLESTPFKVCKNTNELCEAIKKFDDKKYQKEVDKFLKDRGCYETGNASEKVVDKILEIMNEK